MVDEGVNVRDKGQECLVETVEVTGSDSKQELRMEVQSLFLMKVNRSMSVPYSL